jgi:hypothetical protein
MPMDVSCSFGAISDSAGIYGVQPQNTAVNSQEQIFSPVLIRKGIAYPQHIAAFESPGWTSSESGPFGNNQVGPTRNELDPYFSTVFGDDGTEWIKECDFQMMVNDGQPVKGSAGDELNIRKVDRETIDQVVVNGFRGPLVLSGWGFDICDRPVPPKAWDEPFAFDEEVVNDRSKWKTGPVNLQWDDERKVWQGGPQILCGVASGGVPAASSPCSPASFTMKVFRKSETGLDACVLGETVTVINRDPSLSQSAVTGMVFVVAVRINYEWIPIWVGCPEGPPPETPPPCTDCTQSGTTNQGGGYDPPSSLAGQASEPDRWLDQCGNYHYYDPRTGREWMESAPPEEWRYKWCEWRSHDENGNFYADGPMLFCTDRQDDDTEKNLGPAADSMFDDPSLKPFVDQKDHPPDCS